MKKDGDGQPIFEYYLTNWLSGALIQKEESIDATVSLSEVSEKVQRIVEIEKADENFRKKYTGREIALQDGPGKLDASSAAELYSLGLVLLEVLGMTHELLIFLQCSSAILKIGRKNLYIYL